MTAVLTPALVALRDGFNVAFPNRSKDSDGWIGDEAHQETVSGHNPDDTPGVRAEYSDSDTTPEVRAIDVDVNLNSAVTMQNVIDRVLVTPNDLMRLNYIIYNRVIWSKSNGWRPAEYTGLDPHTGHSHWSGDPLYDENDDIWSVAFMGDEMPYEEYQMQAFPWQYTGKGIGENNGTTVKRSTLNYFDEVLDCVRKTLEKVSEPVQVQVVLPPEVLDTLNQILAKLNTLPADVANEEAARLAE